jgi:hypothetical protein
MRWRRQQGCVARLPSAKRRRTQDRLFQPRNGPLTTANPVIHGISRARLPAPVVLEHRLTATFQAGHATTNYAAPLNCRERCQEEADLRACRTSASSRAAWRVATAAAPLWVASQASQATRGAVSSGDPNLCMIIPNLAVVPPDPPGGRQDGGRGEGPRAGFLFGPR